MATSTRPFTPLPDIESPEFTKQYELSVWRRMQGEEQGCGLVAVSYLVTNLKRYAASYPVEAFAYRKQSAQEVQLCSTVVF